jgi:hypothetical protein
MSRAAWRAGLLLLLISPANAPAGEPEPRLRLLVPAYFYPAGEGLKHWDRLIESAGRVHVLAIVNPASGPGEKADPEYTRLLDRARKQPGLTLLGYVSTRHGKRPAADVKADVDRWLRLYPQVQGVFFDEQASGADQADAYAALYAYARKERRLQQVVTNPGTVCAESYLARPAADVACLFEGADGFADFHLPAWAAGYEPARFGALAHKIGTVEQMRQVIGAAPEKRVGLLYVTDATGDDPWDRLPAYWDEEVAAVQHLNRRKAP